MRWNPAKLAWALTIAASAAACREPNPYVEPPPSSYSVAKVELASDSTRDSVNVALVQPNFAPASKVRVLLGRFIVQGEYGSGTRVVVISNDLWARRFGSTPSVIGHTIRLNGQDATIVGVVPANFTFPKDVSAWVPGPPK